MSENNGTATLDATETAEHRVVGAWKGDEPGSCGFECLCGDVFDGFDSIAEAEACHKPLKDKVSAEVEVPRPDPRAEYIRGLREVADWLEAHPEVPLPYIGSTQTGNFESTLHIYLQGESQKSELATIARAMGKAEKVAIDSLQRFNLVRRFAGIAVVAVADREEVCEKIVTGTEVVTKKIKDPEALAAVPEIEVTEKVEQYKWVCHPLLADEPTRDEVRAVIADAKASFEAEQAAAS